MPKPGYELIDLKCDCCGVPTQIDMLGERNDSFYCETCFALVGLLAFCPGMPVTDAAGVKGIIIKPMPEPALRTWLVMDVNYDTFEGYNEPHSMHEDDLELDHTSTLVQLINSYIWEKR